MSTFGYLSLQSSETSKKIGWKNVHGWKVIDEKAIKLDFLEKKVMVENVNYRKFVNENKIKKYLVEDYLSPIEAEPPPLQGSWRCLIMNVNQVRSSCIVYL